MIKRLLPLIFVLFVSSLIGAEAPHVLRVGPLLEEPMGYGETDLQLSWQLTSGSQTAWEVRCSSSPDTLPESGDLWESGKQESSQNLFVDYAGKPLGSRDAVYWTVRYWDASGTVSEWAKTSRFELGLLKTSDWQGKWLSHPEHNPEKSWFAPYFRKPFESKEKVESARLYFSAEGIVDFHINGSPVSQDLFAPGWPDYNKRRLARSVDVTYLVNSGQNVIGAVLADGWFSGNLLFDKRGRHGGVPALLCQLELTYPDGTREVIVSDETWKTSTGPVVSADFYNGETYDASLELGDWLKDTYDDSSWSAVATRPIDPTLPINAHAGPAVRVVDRRPPVSWTRSDSGSLIFDFGVNLVGVAEIALPLEAGQTVTLRHSEALNPDGSPHYKNLRSAKSTNRFTAAVTDTVAWSPRFTYHGFRYLELIGVDPSLEPDEDWVHALVLTSEVPSTGDFYASFEDWNQLQSNIRRSQLGNFLEVPLDCPQRNERLGWTGDIQVFGPTASFNFQSLAFLEKWCRDLRDSQSPSGQLSVVAPDVSKKWAKGTPAWGDAITVVPWDMYQKYGYKRILRDNYKAMIDWVAYYDLETASNDGLWVDFGYADWLQPYQINEDRPRRGDTNRSLLGTAYYARSADLLAKTAAVLGHEKDAERFAARAQAVKQRFASAFFKDGKMLPGEDRIPTQTSYLLALAFDLLPEADRQTAVDELERLIVEEADGHLRTGFVGTALICRTLSRFGKTDLAYSIAMKDTYPSWIYSIRQGATTIWERWNSYSLENGFEGASMNSLNHYAYGAVGQWLYETVGGLKNTAPGYRSLRIAPEIGGGLTEAVAVHETPYGTAQSVWTLADGKFSIEVIVPPNCDAVVVLPNGEEHEVGPGVTELSCSL